MEFGKRCIRFKKAKGGVRCAEFGEADMGDDLGDFGIGQNPNVSGPLIGGGVAQVGALATRMIFKGQTVAKYASLVGLVLGGGISAFLARRPGTREAGIAGLVTAAVVSIPRQIEDLMVSAGMLKGHLGVITPEQEMNGFGLITDQQVNGFGVPDVQLLDSGGGAGVFGVITPEQQMNGASDDVQIMGASDDVQIMGSSGGFGSNFLA